jgi:hypothetical protein
VGIIITCLRDALSWPITEHATAGRAAPVYTFVVSSRPCMPNKLQLTDVCRPDRDQAGLARQVKRRYILYVMSSGTLTLVN